MAYPANYRYTREHEWIAVEGNIGTIGITDYAQQSLGDIVYVDAPKPGDSVTANATFGSVESVKAVSDLYSPVSGTVTEVNRVAEDRTGQDQRRAPRDLDYQGGTVRPEPVRRPSRCFQLRKIRYRRNRLTRAAGFQSWPPASFRA